VPPDPPESFGAAQAAPNFFVLDPSHVRSRLNDMLAAMRAAKRWPWEQVMVELYRKTVWPYLYTRLADQDEADRWRGEIVAARAILRGQTAVRLARPQTRVASQFELQPRRCRNRASTAGGRP
jgi:hypothetical protein